MPKDTAQSNQDSSLVARHSSLCLAEARALVASPLWPRIRVFLWKFEALCDPSRLAGEAGSEPGETGSEPGEAGSEPGEAGGEPGEAGSEPGETPDRSVAGHTWPAIFHPFPATDASRLLLLPRESYDLLARFLGVVALAPALRRVTAGAEVRTLKAALPGVYPEALAFAAYFRKHENLFKGLEPAEPAASPPVEDPPPAAPHSSLVTRRSSLPEAVPAAGHSLLALALSDLPPELVERQRLRFPAGSPADSALGDSSLAARHSSLAGEALAAARLALKLSNPQEYQQCFS